MCAFPYSVRLKPTPKYTGGRNIGVPCGKCPECVRQKTNAWTFRINLHLQITSNPLFITLTYDKKNLPTTVDKQTGEILQIPTLNPRDVQLFLKKLRNEYNKISPKKISYYLCGEYGTIRGRPHYHMLLFNMDSPAILQNCWGRGFVHSRPLLDGGISYTLKYMGKLTTRSDGQVREFSRMSKGLGSNYLTDNVVDMHVNDLSRCYITLAGGIKIPMPKYFKDKIYTTDQREAITDITQARFFETEDHQCKRFLTNRPRNSKNNKITTYELAKLSQNHLLRHSEIF